MKKQLSSKISSFPEFMDARLEDFVDSYNSAVQALADAEEEYHDFLFAPEHSGDDVIENLDMLDKRRTLLKDDLHRISLELSDFMASSFKNFRYQEVVSDTSFV